MSDGLVTYLAAMVDRSLMRGVSLLVERRLLPREADLDTLRDSICAMLDTGLTDRPQSFFRFVHELERRSRSTLKEPRSTRHRRVRGGCVYRCELASTHKPSARLPLVDTHAETQNNIVFEHWIHEPDTAVGTIIVLHGFAMGWPGIDAVALSTAQWFELGFNVVLLTLPDHGPRRAPHSMISGKSFTVPDAVRLAGAVHQAVYEIFELKRWLRTQGDRPIGLMGMSLGGYLTSLCAGLSADFDFLIPLVPPACMGDLAWRVYRDTGLHKMRPDKTLNQENLRAAFYIHSPLAHPRKIAKERILIAAGAGDRIVPPEHPSALWEHWDYPEIHWFRGAHVSAVGNKSLMRVAERHLRQLDIL
jgi:hypothetical protein